MRAKTSTGELHGAEGDCKSSLSGSTPALVSTLHKPRVRQLTSMRNGIRVYSNEYEPVPTLYEVIERAQHLAFSQGDAELNELVRWWREYSLLDQSAKERLHIAEYQELHRRLIEISKENSQLKRENERLKRGVA